MNVIDNLEFCIVGRPHAYKIPEILKDSLRLISNYFLHNSNNKLCLVYPSKNFAAQWISLPMILYLIESDYGRYKSEMIESYKQYKPSELLILNNKAIVEWIGIKVKQFEGPTFKTRGSKKGSGAEITIRYSDVMMLQRAPATRKALSSLELVKTALPSRDKTPLENLLNIDARGNKEFIKNSLCLVCKYKSYDDSIVNKLMNQFDVNEFFKPGKIDENGIVSENSPLLISNNCSNLILYLIESTSVSNIVIDGFNSVTPKSDFLDFDRQFKIPTLLITDLSEIDSFEEISNCGFDIFNYSSENITINDAGDNSPFYSFENKLNNYVSFIFKKEICVNTELESLSKILHSLPSDNSDDNLNILRISLFRLSNLSSRICYNPNKEELIQLDQKITKIEDHFNRCSLWLGEATNLIKDAISLLRKYVQNMPNVKTEKCDRFEMLLQHNYDYIICPTEEEAVTLKKYIFRATPKIISVSDVNDELLSDKKTKAILTGWPRGVHINRLISSFVFSEITGLFYQFESRYYSSLQNRNRRNNNYIKPTISKEGVSITNSNMESKGFEDLYPADDNYEPMTGIPFDIVKFELSIDNTQYSKYFAKGNPNESIIARRIDFENNTFIYTTESHKLHVVNEIIDAIKSNPSIISKKLDSLLIGDVIAIINTDRDILVEMVNNLTAKEEYEKVKVWIDLWKNLLESKYTELNYDFKRLAQELISYECKRHLATIRNWLNDENMIGPEDDNDLRVIARMAHSDILLENIDKAREAIRTMTGWRMKASDLIRDKIKNKLLEITNRQIINTSIDIQGLGRVEILKVSEIKNETEKIDIRFINRLLPKVII